MRHLSALTSAIAAAVVSFASVRAQDTVPEDAYVEAPASASFRWTRFDGRITRLRGATPKQIIENLTPGTPIVGVRHLPTDVRYSIRLSDNHPALDILLSRLGEKLGLKIAIRDTASEFLIVRNHTTGVPRSWERSTDDVEGFIRVIDERDGLYRATDVSVTSLLQFITDHDDRPVLNQCALWGRYSFSFLFPNEDAVGLLKSFGFDVKLEQRTAKAVVIRKPNAED